MLVASAFTPIFCNLAAAACAVADLNADGRELAGTWSQNGMEIPLTFKRAADAK